MERSLRTDRFENRQTLFGQNFSVGLVFDDESRDVLDNGADGLNVALGILDHDSNFGTRDSQTPETLAMTIDKASKRLLYLLKVETERIKEVELEPESVIAQEK